MIQLEKEHLLCNHRTFSISGELNNQLSKAHLEVLSYSNYAFMLGRWSQNFQLTTRSQVPLHGLQCGVCMFTLCICRFSVFSSCLKKAHMLGNSMFLNMTESVDVGSIVSMLPRDKLVTCPECTSPFS